MKKLVLTVAIILGGLSTYATSAVVVSQADKIVTEVKGEYKEIKASELPQAVKDALAADFNRATLNKAYVNAKEEYKLLIAVQEVTSAVHYEKVYVDKNGNWIVKGKVLLPASNPSQDITKN